MTDPDAPSVSNPAFREFVHWVVVNIPGNNVESGEKVLSYLGAGPPYNGGIHRYMFLLFRQKNPMSAIQIGDATEYFNSRGQLRSCEWARSPGVGMGAPVGFNGFVSGWSPYVDLIHEKVGFMPPEEFQSPAQKEKVIADALAKLMLERAAKAGEAPSVVLHSIYKFGIDTKAVFDGCVVNKKFGNEIINQKRYVWIDDPSKKLFWSKTNDKSEASKSISLCDDVRIKSRRKSLKRRQNMTLSIYFS